MYRGALRASSPNRRRQFGHQVPRWKATSTGPRATYSSSERRSPRWVGNVNAGARSPAESVSECRCIYLLMRGNAQGPEPNAQSLEESDLHLFPCFDALHVGRDLEVAIGACHARDVARALEGGLRSAVLQPDGVELVPS